ncbi:MAG: glycosyltransferase, partial [Brachybacterium sp.]|nr:glycosyltransferase [Brachybacterium sp.]
MHILFIPSWYPQDDKDFGGSFFREQAEAFVPDHQVGVLALKTFPIYRVREYARGTRSELTYSDERGVNVVRLNRVSPVPKMHRLNNALAIRDVRRAYRDYVASFGAPDVLHSHSMFDAGIWSAALAEEQGIPFVLTEHRPSS